MLEYFLNQYDVMPIVLIDSRRKEFAEAVRRDSAQA